MLDVRFEKRSRIYQLNNKELFPAEQLFYVGKFADYIQPHYGSVAE